MTILTTPRVNGEEAEGAKEVRDSASHEKDLPWQRSPVPRTTQCRFIEKIHAPLYRHPRWVTSDSNNSTDTNALSAGADSPGERGACSFLPGIATVAASTFARFASILHSHRKLIRSSRARRLMLAY